VNYVLKLRHVANASVIIILIRKNARMANERLARYRMLQSGFNVVSNSKLAWVLTGKWIKGMKIEFRKYGLNFTRFDQ
jgi:hypothetical protein